MQDHPVVEDDFTGMTLKQRLDNKKWKARIHGYEELIKKFAEAEDDTSPVFREYASAIKTIMDEKNVIAQEKGMPAIVTWIDRAPSAPRHAFAISKKLVEKCLCARPKTKLRTIESLLLFVEREQPDPVLKALIEGSKHKVPKTAAAAIEMMQTALEAFGPKVMAVKALLTNLPRLFEYTDKKAREATMNLSKCLYRFIGDSALKVCLANLRSAQLKELEDFFASEAPGSLKPTRYLRSVMEQGIPTGEEDLVDDEEMDSYNLLDPIDVLAKLDEGFFELIESKSWKDRKQMIDNLASIVDAPRIMPKSELSSVYRALKQILAKDVNLFVVTKALECVTSLAAGLRGDFNQAAKILTPSLLNRLKEKKITVKSAVHASLDSIYQNSISLSDILTDVCEAFTEHKLPFVRSEALIFLLRCLEVPSKRLKGRPPVGKEDVKVIARACIKAMDDGSGDVRDGAAKTLGTLTGIVGERVTQPFLAKLDGVRLKKVKDCIPEKTAPIVPLPSKSPPPTSTIPPKRQPVPKKNPTATKQSSAPTKSQAKPKSRPQNKKPAAEPSVPVKKAPAVPKKVHNSMEYSRLIGAEEAQVEIEELLTEPVIDQLNDKQWQARQGGVQIVGKMIETLHEDQELAKYSNLLARQLITKPGFKETNFNVMNATLDAIIILCKFSPSLSKGAAAELIEGAATKLADVKSKLRAAEILDLMAANHCIQPYFVIDHVIKHTKNHRNPKIIQEALHWISSTVSLFGTKELDICGIVEFCESGYLNTNPHVRNSSTELVVVLWRFVGSPIRDLLQNVKPAILVTIDKEIEKSKALPPLVPTKNTIANAAELPVAATTVQPTKRTQDNFSKCITMDLLDQLHDKDWRERKQGLLFVQTNLRRYEKVPFSASLLHALAERLNENNGSLLVLTLNIFEELVVAIGPGIQKNLSFLPNILRCLGDSKKPVSSSALKCLENLSLQVPLESMMEFFPEALESSARTALFPFLTNALKSNDYAKKIIEPLIVPTLQSLQDRSPDIRKAAGTFIERLVSQFGRDTILEHVRSLRPGIQTGVISVIDKLVPTNTTTEQNDQQSNAASAILAKNTDKISREKTSGHWFIENANANHISLLKKQMKGNFSSELLSLLFGNALACKKGIHMLTCALRSLTQETICSVDLILKWSTIQIASSSPDMISAVLEYVIALFDMLDAETYALTEFESSAFFPVLVHFQGSMKRSLSSSEEFTSSTLPTIFLKASRIYPAGKLCLFLANVLGDNDTDTVLLSLELLYQLVNKIGVRAFISGLKAHKKEFSSSLVNTLSEGEPINQAAKKVLNLVYGSLKEEFWTVFTRSNTLESIVLPSARTTSVEVSNQDNIIDNLDVVSLNTLTDWFKVLESQRASRCISVLKLICSNLEQSAIPLSQADALIYQFSKLSNFVFNEQPISVRFCKYLLRSWQVAFSKKTFINSISIRRLEETIKQILLELQNEQLAEMKDDGKQIVQALYNAVLLILNNYDRTDTFVIFLNLLETSMNEADLQPKYIDCLVKCLVKLAKTLSATIKTLQIERIIVGLNDFFLNAPKGLSLTCEPHRMIKTILNEMVRLQGEDLLVPLYSAFPGDTDTPPVCIYTKQFLKANGMATELAIPKPTRAVEEIKETKKPEVKEIPRPVQPKPVQPEVVAIPQPVQPKPVQPEVVAVSRPVQPKPVQPEIVKEDLANNDVAESYMDKLTRLRDKYKTQKIGQTSAPLTQRSGNIIANPISQFSAPVKPLVIDNSMPKPSLYDIKKQLQDVKAMSPQKPGAAKSKLVFPSSPSSQAPSSSALADLKNQLHLLKGNK